MKLKYLKIKGEACLSGDVEVSGSKNAILPILFSSLLVKGHHFFTNVPKLKDVEDALEMLKDLGLKTKQLQNQLFIDNSYSFEKNPAFKKASSFRASILCLGPLMALSYRLKLPLPGGCQIGSRPIDLHLEGLRKMGVSISIQKKKILAIPPAKGLKACHFKLPFPSVGATENLIMACVLAKGTSYLENIAYEPEILDLITYLKKMGAKIERKKRTLKITGVKKLKALKKSYSIIPDRIEAGTWLLAGACTRGQICIKKCNPKHLSFLLKKLKSLGFKIESQSDQILLKKSNKNYPGISIKTGVYPSFPTDLQAQFMALMLTLKGESSLKETIFEKRFRYIEQLNNLGAGIQFQGSSKVYVKGPAVLKAKSITAHDLRAGAGLILAALTSKGITKLYGLQHLERGYENLVFKLRYLGAEVKIQSP
ncbi:MAG: UDP-N-acetylglucosamine 1-carboxyvinyltransferase [Bdellovibrionales bacterium]|nr:UDP-N-acetylglucosamine 1-carboxyvinyltransferase [Bdellovibrionales bacterium]